MNEVKGFNYNNNFNIDVSIKNGKAISSPKQRGLTISLHSSATTGSTTSIMYLIHYLFISRGGQTRFIFASNHLVCVWESNKVYHKSPNLQVFQMKGL